LEECRLCKYEGRVGLEGRRYLLKRAEPTGSFFPSLHPSLNFNRSACILFRSQHSNCINETYEYELEAFLRMKCSFCEDLTIESLWSSIRDTPDRRTSSLSTFSSLTLSLYRVFFEIKCSFCKNLTIERLFYIFCGFGQLTPRRCSPRVWRVETWFSTHIL